MRIKLIILACVVVAALLFHILTRAGTDPLDQFPHTFITQAGYDPSGVVVVSGPLSFQPPAPEGTAPAWRCDAPPFADAEGHPWLFPMEIPQDGGRPTPPVHPTVGKAPSLDACQRYQTPEGVKLLDDFLKANGR